jgi:histone H1/5
MSYKAGIVKAIAELKDRTGSSSIAIKKHMQANMPADKKWMNTAFLKALRDGVTAGDLVQVKGSYKLSASFKENAKSAGKPKKAPKKKAAPKKTAPKKKSAPKKKTVSAFYFYHMHAVSVEFRIILK